MIMSMTGFGKARRNLENVQISVEIKAVNSRFLETSIRLPRQLSAFEPEVKDFLKKHIERGKVSVVINFNAGRSLLSSLKLDKNLARQYLDIADEIKSFPGINNDLTISDLLNLPDVVVFDFDEEKESELNQILMDCLKDAVVSFNETRHIEGNALAEDIVKRLKLLTDYLGQIKILSKDVVKENIEKLKTRINEISEFEKLDKDRLETEVVLLADRLDITEEIIRLQTHLDACEKSIAKERHPGKKLNFLAQEMHREANTIGSKSGKIEITQLSVSLKEEIEKIREQVQNIE